MSPARTYGRTDLPDDGGDGSEGCGQPLNCGCFDSTLLCASVYRTGALSGELKMAPKEATEAPSFSKLVSSQQTHTTASLSAVWRNLPNRIWCGNNIRVALEGGYREAAIARRRSGAKNHSRRQSFRDQSVQGRRPEQDRQPAQIGADNYIATCRRGRGNGGW